MLKEQLVVKEVLKPVYYQKHHNKLYCNLKIKWAAIMENSVLKIFGYAFFYKH